MGARPGSVVCPAASKFASRMGGDVEELPVLDISTFPPVIPGETVNAYLLRCLSGGVSKGGLARHLDVQRTFLYQVLDGSGVAPKTLTRFGALVGMLVDDQPTRELLTKLDLIEPAELGWKSRAYLQTPEGKRRG